MGPVLRYMQPLEREAQPEDVANAVVFLSSDRAAQVTGIVFPIDGGTTAGPPLAQTKLIMSTACSPTATRSAAGVSSSWRRCRPRRKNVGRYSYRRAPAGPCCASEIVMSLGAVEEPVERDPTLGPGERRAGARVDAVPEADVLAGVGPLDVELVRVRRTPAGRGCRRRGRA